MRPALTDGFKLELKIQNCVITTWIWSCEENIMATKDTGGDVIHTENEFDRIYAFYQGLERQERQSKLVPLILLCSAVVAVLFAAWIIQHPISWNQVTTPFEMTR
jgi:cytoskeletal protein RodZ